MPPRLMQLEIVLPSGIFARVNDVSRIVAETTQGSLGLLPRRLDCVASLAPGILSYETASAGEIFVAVDAGVLVKYGRQVRVAVRRAFTGDNLAQLHQQMSAQFAYQGEQEQDRHKLRKRLESGFLRRFVSFQHE